MITVFERHGAIYLSNALKDVRVASGRMPKLTSLSVLWWLDGVDLKHANVAADLSISAVTIYAQARSYALRDMGDLGTAVAYLQAANLILHVGSTVYTLAWDLVRSDDFDFELSNDLQSLAVIYRRPGSPNQAFVSRYSAHEDVYIVEDALLRLYDFELGARTLEAHAEMLTR